MANHYTLVTNQIQEFPLDFDIDFDTSVTHVRFMIPKILADITNQLTAMLPGSNFRAFMPALQS